EIYIRGQRQQIGRGFTFDPATSTITLADELEAGGSAIGGETQIVLDVVVDSVSEIYIRGQRQQIGRGFTFDPATSTITLADELEAG
ncbi:hypothetical protein CQA65_30410, partial [Klebsiella pneumoniae]